MSHHCDGRDLSCPRCVTVAERHDLVRGALTLDDRLDDIKRAQIWSRLEARLGSAKPPVRWAPRAALLAALAAGVVIVVAATRGDQGGAARTFVAPRDTMLSLRLGHAHASLVGPARLDVVDATPGATTVRLRGGTLLAELEAGRGRTLRITAPGATIEVVGTLFAVDVRGATTCVSVAHGSVRMTTANPTRTQMIRDGQRACSDGRAPGAIDAATRDVLARHAAVITTDLGTAAAPAHDRAVASRDASDAVARAAAPRDATDAVAIAVPTAPPAAPPTVVPAPDSRPAPSVASSPVIVPAPTSQAAPPITPSPAVAHAQTSRPAPPATPLPAAPPSSAAVHAPTSRSARPVTPSPAVDHAPPSRFAPPVTPSSVADHAPPSRFAPPVTPSSVAAHAPTSRSAPPVTPSIAVSTPMPQSVPPTTPTPATVHAPTSRPVTPSPAEIHAPTSRLAPPVAPPPATPSQPPAAAQVVTASSLYRDAETALAARDLASADRHLAALLAQFPESALLDQALYERARIAYRQRAWAAAQRQLDRLSTIQASPLLEPGAYLSCRIAFEASDGGAAACLADYRARYPRSPHDAEVLGMLTDIAFRAGGCTAAQPEIAKLRRDHPEVARTRGWQRRCPEVP
jgi:hypothetical protein